MSGGSVAGVSQDGLASAWRASGWYGSPIVALWLQRFTALPFPHMLSSCAAGFLADAQVGMDVAEPRPACRTHGMTVSPRTFWPARGRMPIAMDGSNVRYH